MININCEVKYNKKTMNGLAVIPDDILFAIASQTLSFAVSREIIPIGKTHNLLESSTEFGVHRAKGDMTIGSPTSYATRVWNLPQATTKWTNKGKAHNRWYAYTLKKYGKTFIDNAINQSWRKDML